MKTKKELQAALRKAKRQYANGIRYYDEKYSTFNPAWECENILEHVSDLLGFYGVESYDVVQDVMRPDYQYCNSGDSYGLTVVYSRKRGQYLITDIGSIAEREYQKGQE
jgi:hypothetical protein